MNSGRMRLFTWHTLTRKKPARVQTTGRADLLKKTSVCSSAASGSNPFGASNLKSLIPLSRLARESKRVPVPVTCCKCGRRHCTRSNANQLKDHILGLWRWYPWKCTVCGARFYLRRKSDDPDTRIRLSVKQDDGDGEGQSRIAL